MTTAAHFLACERMTDRAETLGFVVTPDMDGFCIRKVDGHWHDLTDGMLRHFATAEEVSAWLDGIALAQFMERAKEKA